MTFPRTLTLIAIILCVFSAGHVSAASSNAIHISNNWAGYEASGNTYTAVSASWTVPASAGTDRIISADASWVGIGGITKDDLIQAGTQAIIHNGQTSYTAWYEVLPDTQQTVPLAVNPGDQVSVSIREVVNGYWLITISNHTTGQTYQHTFAYASSRSSAEWVVERPLAITGNATGYLPLSDFDTVSFTDAQTVTQDGTALSLADAKAEPLVMGSTGSRLLAAPSDIEGNSFDVSYLTSSESTRYLRMLRRTYSIRQKSSTPMRTQPNYQQINTNYVIRVIF